MILTNIFSMAIALEIILGVTITKDVWCCWCYHYTKIYKMLHTFLNICLFYKLWFKALPLTKFPFLCLSVPKIHCRRSHLHSTIITMKYYAFVHIALVQHYSNLSRFLWIFFDEIVLQVTPSCISVAGVILSVALKSENTSKFS